MSKKEEVEKAVKGHNALVNVAGTPLLGAGFLHIVKVIIIFFSFSLAFFIVIVLYLIIICVYRMY